MTDNTDTNDEWEPPEEIDEIEEYEGRDLLRNDIDGKLTLTVNNQEFALTGDFLEMVEENAERRYSENEYLDYHWRVATGDDEDHEPGDPLLCIETHGPIVPWENLSEMAMEMQSISGADDDTSSANARDVDNGDGTAGVDPESPDGDEGVDDFKIVMTPERFRQYPDPDDEDFETLPPEPEEYPDHEPELVVPIPDSGREERWDTGRAITSAITEVEWNIQARADSAPEGAKDFAGDDRHDSHNQWEALLRAHDCEVVGEVQPSGKPNEDSGSEADRKPWDYDSADGTVSDGAVGDRWQL